MTENQQETKLNDPLLRVECKCGNKLEVPNPDGWGMNVVGMLQFYCPKCKWVTSSVDHWINIPTSNIEPEKTTRKKFVRK